MLARFGFQSKIVPVQNVTVAGGGQCLWAIGPNPEPSEPLCTQFLTQLAEFAIYDQATWEKVLSQAFCGGSNPCAISAPNIDFSSTTVLAVFLGWKGSTAYAVRISQVERTGHTIIVHVQITVPGPNCAYAAMMTYPYDIVTIPKTQRSIVFQTETVVPPICR